MTNMLSNETLTDLKDYTRRLVAAGFESAREVIESAVEAFSDQADADVLRPVAERFTPEAVRDQLAEQAHWPAKTDCDRLDIAFDQLTRHGVICRQNFSCCGTCGVAEIGDEMEHERETGIELRGFCFYHRQDTEAAVEGGGLYLNYGAVEGGEKAGLKVGRTIVAVLQEHGLETKWNGRWDTRIWVQVDWKRWWPHEVEGRAC